MSITNTQTKYFTSGEIKFSAIRDTFGDLAGTDVRASDYLRNAGDDVDWEAPGQTKTISPRVPNATENADVSTSTDWEVSDLRDSIVEYNVTQDASTSDEELEFADTNVPTWNNNLSKNVNKKFSVEGTIYANEVSKYALTFSDGEYNNLTIDVPDGGKIYGEGGAAGGGNGGGALYVKNTASYDNVSVTLGSNGQIWAGGGGGDNGTDGNSGSSISCFTNSTHNASYNQNNRNYDSNAASNACTAAAPSGSYDVVVTTATPTSVRSRCRGGNFRSGQGWNSTNKYGYACSPAWSVGCSSKIANNIAGGNGGTGGNGGVGQGFSNQSAPGSGNSGNAGNTNTCAATGANSVGNDGNSGSSGGTWGVGASNGGNAGFALLKQGTAINQGQTANNVKGPVGNI